MTPAPTAPASDVPEECRFCEGQAFVAVVNSDRQKHCPVCRGTGRTARATRPAPGVEEAPALDWKHCEARSPLGDLYEVVRLSPIVWQTSHNGVAFPGWQGDEATAKSIAQSDFERRWALSKLAALPSSSREEDKWRSAYRELYPKVEEYSLKLARERIAHREEIDQIRDRVSSREEEIRREAAEEQKAFFNGYKAGMERALLREVVFTLAEAVAVRSAARAYVADRARQRASKSGGGSDV